nr:MFS transporter [Adhaeretor mobilis]
MISGVGLYPFAISIILFSLIVDRIGYGTSIAIAFCGHIVSTVLTIFAPSYEVLYVATFIYALSNGIVEAVINPVVATIYKDNKTHWLNVLHAGWPGGLVLGGLLAIVILKAGGSLGESLLGELWRWKMTILLLPTLAYGFLLYGVKFPTQERVEAGVSYRAMLVEFGWGSAYIVSFLIIMGISQVLTVFNYEPIHWKRALAFAVIPAAIYAVAIRKFDRLFFYCFC